MCLEVVVDQSRWEQAWAEGRTRFHKDRVHPDLQRWEQQLLGAGPARVLVPLCGKTLDLVWLVERGHEVVGVEFVHAAIEAFFEEQGRSPSRQGDAWADGPLTLVQADFFELPDLGLFDAVWDRAALVAIDPSRREAYAAVVRSCLRPGGRLLLNAFEYDQSRMEGPPWSVPEAHVRDLFSGIELLERVDEAGVIGIPGHETWLTGTWLYER